MNIKFLGDKFLVISDKLGSIRIWDIETNQMVIENYKVSRGWIKSFATLCDNILVIASYGGECKVVFPFLRKMKILLKSVQHICSVIRIYDF